MTRNEDRRPPSKPRKQPRLWLYYQMWREQVKLRIRWENARESAKRGKCNYDIDVIDFHLNSLVIQDPDNRAEEISFEDYYYREMKREGHVVGPIWDWLLSIRGIGEATAAKLLAQIDDIAKFERISNLWRFAGWGIYEYWFDAGSNVMAPRDGYQFEKCRKGLYFDCPGCSVQMERKSRKYVCPECGWDVKDREKIKIWRVAEPKPGWTLREGVIDRLVSGWASPFNKILKAEVWVAVDMFVKLRSPVYRDEYDKIKRKLRRKYPEKIRENNGWKYTVGHINNMAYRKVAKVFLSHLWLKWRELEGLPISDPYVVAVLGHNMIKEPVAR